MMLSRQDLRALRNLIEEARVILQTSPSLPQGRTPRALELLESAVAMTDNLIATPTVAASLGKKGGTKTAERGPEYFAKIAGMRKTNAGGRPKKNGTV